MWLIEKADTKASAIFKTHFSPSEDKIIFFSHWALSKFKLETKQSDCHLANDLLSLKEVKDIEEKYHQFCTRWKYQEEKDYTLIDEISYGFLNEPALHQEFHLLLLMKYGELYRKVFERFPAPARVFHDISNVISEEDCGDHFAPGFYKSDLLEQILVKNQIKTTRISKSAPNGVCTSEEIIFKQPLSRISSKVEKSLRMRRRIWYSNLKQFFFKIFCAQVKPTCYIFNYFNINRLAEKFGRLAYISEMGRKNLTAGNILIDINQSDSKPDKRFEEKTTKVLSRIDKIRDGFFNFKGIDYASFFKPALSTLVRHHFADSRKYYLNFTKSLSSKNLKGLVTVDVFNRKGRALVEFSKSVGLKSFFVAHGIGCSPYRERHLKGAEPDCVIGPDNKLPDSKPEYSLSSRHVQLGNPSLDHYLSSERKTISRLSKIMLQNWQGSSFNRIDRFGNEELFNFELIKVIKFLLRENIEFHFRPRPYYKDLYDSLFLQNGINPNDIIVSALNKPFPETIKDYDLVIGNTSTSLHESYASGVPYIMLEPIFDPSNFTGICAGENWKDIIRSKAADEIIEIIKRNRDDAKEIRSFFKNFYERNEKKFYHAFDGQSSSRIFEFINQECTHQSNS